MNDGNREAAIAAKKQLSAQFFKRGVFIAIMSGVFYGLYTAFMTLAMTKGVWGDWYGRIPQHCLHLRLHIWLVPWEVRSTIAAVQCGHSSLQESKENLVTLDAA